MVIKTNVSALTASRNLLETNKSLSSSLARLSSGSKLVNPADNAGGFAVSMRLDAQLSRIAAAEDNVGNALSFSQTQDGYLKKVAKALDRLGELVNLQQFVTAASERDFNGVSMFAGNGINVTIDSEASTFNYTACNLTSTTFTNATSGVDITTTGNATTALTRVKDALTELASQRAKVGANQSALSMYHEQLGTLKDNLTAANSRIKDVDVAQESTTYAKFNILAQAGTAMLSQANSSSQGVLRLLG
jgi:flagellin